MDESGGNARPSAERSQSAILICIALRAHGAQSGVKGGERKRVPSGHNRRRRLATGSRQPKRGFGTAVPKTTIEVAERRLSALCRSTFPANQLRVRSTEDEDSPERATAVRSPRPVGERAAERCSRAMAANQGFSTV